MIDLELPIRSFWEAERILKHADYLIASGEEPIEVREAYNRFFRIVATYAINEKDRVWLFDRVNNRGNS